MTATPSPVAAPTVRRLGNGLRVVLDPRPACGRVAVCVHYGVGFRSERPGEAGLAHLFEHLMFRGSAALPDGRFFDHVHALGGEANGTTHQDYTDYYQVVSASGLPRALFAEADRMRAPLFTPAAVREQIEGVRQEITGALHGRPFGGLPWPALPAVLHADFAHGHDGYGDPDELVTVTPERCRRFFDRHYGPGNAVLTVSGGFDPELTDRWIDDLFADIPARPVPDRPGPPRSTAAAARRVVCAEPRSAARVTVFGAPVAAYDQDPGGYLARWVLTRLLDPTPAGRASGRDPGRWDVGLGYFGPLDAIGDDVLVATCVAPADRPDQAPADLTAALGRLADLDQRRGLLVRDRARELAREQSHQLDEIVGRARLLGRSELLFGGAAAVTTLPDRLADVSVDAVAGAAAELRAQAADGGSGTVGVITVEPGRERTRPRPPLGPPPPSDVSTTESSGHQSPGRTAARRPVHPVPVLGADATEVPPLPLRVLARRRAPGAAALVWLDRPGGGPVAVRARWSLTVIGRRHRAAVQQLVDRVRESGPADPAVAWTVRSDGQSVILELDVRPADLPAALDAVVRALRVLLGPWATEVGDDRARRSSAVAPTAGRGGRRRDPRIEVTDFAAADRAYAAAMDCGPHSDARTAALGPAGGRSRPDPVGPLVAAAGGAVVICGPATPGVGPTPAAALESLVAATAGSGESVAGPTGPPSGSGPGSSPTPPPGRLVMSDDPRPGFHELALITEDPDGAMHEPARYLATAALGGHPGSRLARATVRPGEAAARVFAGYDRVADRWRSVLRASVPWSTTADPTAPMDRMLGLLRQELDGWRDHPPEPSELTRTRRYCAAQVPAATDSATALADLVVHVLATGGDLDRLAAFPQRLWLVDGAAVHQAGNRLFTRPADTLVIVGVPDDESGTFAAAAARHGFTRATVASSRSRVRSATGGRTLTLPGVGG